MLDEQGLGQFIGLRYRNPGDRLFRMERLPWYDVASQNADRSAFLNGVAPDWSRKQAWLDELLEDKRRGLVARRVRVFSARLTDDELMSCHYGYSFYGAGEDIRVLHRGEHPIPAVLDHDYWVIHPAGASPDIVRMVYSGSGTFLGADVVTGRAAQEPYLREQALAWAIGVPFADWWAEHPELHRELAA